MAGPQIEVPQWDIGYTEAVFDSVKQTLQNIFADGYHAGYAAGDANAIARILKAVNPTANSNAAPNVTSGATKPVASAGEEPGARTHLLIKLVLLDVGPKGATPAQIFKSPLNTDPISRAAISKVLRRGSKPEGRYVNLGNGQYGLMEGTK